MAFAMNSFRAHGRTERPRALIAERLGHRAAAEPVRPRQLATKPIHQRCKLSHLPISKWSPFDHPRSLASRHAPPVVTAVLASCGIPQRSSHLQPATGLQLRVFCLRIGVGSQAVLDRRPWMGHGRMPPVQIIDCERLMGRRQHSQMQSTFNSKSADQK